MERSHGQHHLLALFLVVLLSTAGSEPNARDVCDSQFLSWVIGTSCVGNLEHPTETCCEGVLAAIGIGFGDIAELPCLCRVANESYLGLVGIGIDNILQMYPTCGGVQPVGPHTAEACQGRD